MTPKILSAGRQPCRRGVDMVDPDGRSGDEPDARTAEQPLVATGARADNQCVGVAHLFGADGAARQVDGLGPRIQHAAQKRDGPIDDDLHGAYK